MRLGLLLGLRRVRLAAGRGHHGGLCPVYSEIEATREVMAGMGCPFRNDSYESFAGALQTALATPAAQIEAWKEKLLIRFSWSRVRDQLVQTLVSLQSP